MVDQVRAVTSLRLSGAEREALRAAARRVGLSLGEFVRRAALRAAARLVRGSRGAA